MDAPPPVLITGVGGTSVGCQILQDLLLCPGRYRIITTDAEPYSFGLYQTESRYIVPRADQSTYLPAILQLIKTEGVRALLPGTEAELMALVQHREDIQAAGCTLVANPLEVVNLCANKWRLFEWLRDNGLDTPRTVRAHDWPELVREVGFPILGKPAENTGGSRGVALLDGEHEVLRYQQEMSDREILFQEYCGTAEDEYTVGVLLTRAGRPIDSIVIHRKLSGISLGARRLIQGKSYALSTGYSQGFVIRHPLIQASCEALAERIGARGPLNVQCRLTAGKVMVFEVHPRFSGTASIRAEAGFNEADVLLRHFLFAEDFGRLDYRSDVAAIRSLRHLLVPISDIDSVKRA